MMAAKRRNARRSTGPTTALGFAGEDTRATEVAYARSLRRSVLARRENAEEFDRVYQEAHGAQSAPWLPTGGFGAEVQHSYSQPEKEELSRNVLWYQQNRKTF